MYPQTPIIMILLFVMIAYFLPSSPVSSREIKEGRCHKIHSVRAIITARLACICFFMCMLFTPSSPFARILNPFIVSFDMIQHANQKIYSLGHVPLLLYIFLETRRLYFLRFPHFANLKRIHLGSLDGRLKVPHK
jgi:uncharacterized membrane protein